MIKRNQHTVPKIDANELIQKHAEGLSCEAIGRFFGVCGDTISLRLKALGAKVTKGAKASLVVVGGRFGALTIQSIHPISQLRKDAVCLCDCGKTITVHAMNLTNLRTKHCGCRITRPDLIEPSKRRNRPKRRNALKAIYGKMISRCYDPKADSYRWYGAKSVTVCDRWLNGENGMSGFECFREDVGERPASNLSLDRIKSHEPYQPGNIRWATFTQQTQNRAVTKWVTYKGKTQTLWDWCKELGLKYTRVYSRLYRQGWGVEDSFESPSQTEK